MAPTQSKHYRLFSSSELSRPIKLSGALLTLFLLHCQPLTKQHNGNFLHQELPTAETSSVSLSPPLTEHSACIALQNNQTVFNTHLGTYIAILENGILPKISISGGSSTIIAAAVMALLQNQTLNTLEVKDGNTTLSKAHKAALILSSSLDIFDSLTLYPNLPEMKPSLTTLTDFLYGFKKENADSRKQKSAFIHKESLVGQSLLLTEFFKSTSFINILAMSSPIARQKAMRKSWLDFSNGIELSHQDLINIIFADFSQKDAAKFKTISSKLDQLFKIDMRLPANISNENWTSMSDQWKKNSKRNFEDELFQTANSENLPASRNRELFLARTIIIPDPELVWKAYEGVGKDGTKITFPTGLVVHSTFKGIKANPGFNAIDFSSTSWSESPGWSHIYQAYMGAPELTNQLYQKKLSINNQSHLKISGFAPKNLDRQKKSYIFDSTNILTFPVSAKQNDVNFSVAMKSALAEYGFFRQDPLDFKISNSIFANQSTEPIIATGSWAENNALTAIYDLAECSSADYLVTSGLGNRLSTTQKNSLRTALEGKNGILKPLLQDDELLKMNSNNENYQNELLNGLNFTNSLSGKLGRIDNNLDWEVWAFAGNSIAPNAFSQFLNNSRRSQTLLGYKNTLNSINNLANKPALFSINSIPSVKFKNIQNLKTFEEFEMLSSANDLL